MENSHFFPVFVGLSLGLAVAALTPNMPYIRRIAAILFLSFALGLYYQSIEKEIRDSENRIIAKIESATK